MTLLTMGYLRSPVAHTQAVSRNPKVAKKGARPGQEVGGEASTRRAP